MIDYLFIVAAYLLGSISSAIIVCRLMGLPDPRSQGSNNPGATNVKRIGGNKPAAITLVGDSLKGLIPMLVVSLLELPPTVIALTGLAAFLGHLYPVFFEFKGGKGVATAIGVQLGLYWPIGLTVIAIWLFVAKILKISSLSALIAMALAPFIVWYFRPETEFILLQVLISLLLFWRHKDNIQRLLSGEESGVKATTDQSED